MFNKQYLQYKNLLEHKSFDAEDPLTSLLPSKIYMYKPTPQTNSNSDNGSGISSTTTEEITCTGEKTKFKSCKWAVTIKNNTIQLITKN
jgi:hypothetical protein